MNVSINMQQILNVAISKLMKMNMYSLVTLFIGNTMNAPPPADSIIIATNLGLTEQNVASHDDLDTLKIYNFVAKLSSYKSRSRMYFILS